METSLLTTKLYIPPARPQIVSRPRLIEILQRGPGYNLVLVSAPAGFGKTTLLSEWARQSQPQIPTAWVSLDEGENDPIRFWDYFIAALQTLQPSVGEGAKALLHSSQTPSAQPIPIESVLTTLINELTTISGDFIAVLDDYHVITSQPIHDGITFLLDHIPPQMHLVIATRADPPLPLTHFRGRGTIMEIGADDLRFTLDEAAALLKELQDLEFSTEDVSTLNERTEGWVTGLKMAALSMRRQEDIPGFIATFTSSQRYVMDYLIEEVLNQQTQEVKYFLLKTSVLERLSAPLCDYVTGRSGSQDMLLNLERANLFIIRLDESRQWYRYEHLFADILRHQLETISGTEDISELHRRASRWYEDNGFTDEAIHHVLVAQDWETATKLITEHSVKIRRSGEFVTLLNCIQSLPEEVLQTHYQLCILYSQALIATRQLDAAESKLLVLEQSAQGDDSIEGEIIVLKADIAYIRGDIHLAEELARKALSVLPSDKLEQRGYTSMILGMIYYSSGEIREAETMFTEAYEASRQAGNDMDAFMALGILAAHVRHRGKLRQAVEMFRKAIEMAGPSPAAAPSHLMLGSILYELNDLEVAVYHEQRAIELARLHGLPERLARAHYILAIIELARGDEAGAIKAMEKGDSEAQKLSFLPSFRAEQAATHIWLALRQDDLATALEWRNKLTEDLDALRWDYRYIPTRLLIVQGKKTAAAEQFQALYEQAAQSEEQSLMIGYRVYQALAADTEEKALEFLADALSMAEPEGYIRTFVDKGRLLAPLLRKAISYGITPEYSGNLLNIIEVEERQRRYISREGTIPPPQELLSERELEVLRLMAAGLSNRQIAERLFISLGTVKTHIHNIFEKLNAQTRTQAVSRARELNLIQLP